MSRFFVGLALWALLLALAACGGDSKGTDPARDAELAEMVDTVVSTYDDLTVCTDKREGTTAYVEDEKKAYVCESKRWTANDPLTESIQNKDSDSAKDAESGEKVDTVVPSFDDLPACTGDLNGKTAYVEDEDSAYVCKKGLWVVDDSLSKAVRPDSEKKSSDGKSSSSGKNNPSSPVASSCKTEAGDNCEYGTLTDDRDGQTYKTVKIGEQWWMAENLNYAYTGVPLKYVLPRDPNLVYYSDSTSWCYDNYAANCAKYGRLYTWAAAMDSAGIIPGNTANGCGYGEICNLGNVKVRGVCPEGWHLPSIDEWDTLLTAVGGEAKAGKMLKSTKGWNDYYGYYVTSGNGSDSYFFSALPAGGRNLTGDFGSEGNRATFLSSTESLSDNAYYMYLDYSDDVARLSDYNKNYGFSVRCLKDYKSSSSEKKSSSSSVVPTNSSSSSVVPTVSVASPCKNEAGDNCEYGTLTDDRDGQTYKTVKIGEQWWMAENLNYAYTGVPFKDVDFTSDSTSWCYDNDAANCAKYGRLYTWAAAMDSPGIIPGNSANGCGDGKDCNLGNVKVRGVCPEGWHLPDTTEWNALRTAVGGWATAGKMLKSTEGWNDYDGTSGNGSDAYSFSALPAGGRYDDGLFYYGGNSALFWSSSMRYNSNRAYYMILNRSNDNAYLGTCDKITGFSVRCLRD